MERPPGSAHMAFGVGGLVLAGGLMGYLKKGSKASLIASGGTAALLFASGVIVTKGYDFEGHALAFGTSSLLAVGMGMRSFKSGKFMPAGLVATIGVVSAAYQAKKTLEWMG
mmetsp:Transcript_10800/g.14016  ORF Transcript_10800/g.14016 Transcript_10800/m.14016 type:complete len:112 (+) Transcript_10800:62-397(+)|eukprot:CAMPEP_0117752956 /NCGR_PEP_ID=MMETSP0947-20121206/11936_1 /TAXON_ID=44440 /ORGANISM="Chattonella subsalsa, Strain CCMP2191" /LENGTH=111 /DNA_ID=CAMNT_0005571741 /DNA_START=34 /DNA_END=369 /DNA_ORIENTATION=-